MPRKLVITVAQSDAAGVFEAHLGNRPLGRSRTPFLNSARVLLVERQSPTTVRATSTRAPISIA